MWIIMTWLTYSFLLGCFISPSLGYDCTVNEYGVHHCFTTDINKTVHGLQNVSHLHIQLQAVYNNSQRGILLTDGLLHLYMMQSLIIEAEKSRWSSEFGFLRIRSGAFKGLSELKYLRINIAILPFVPDKLFEPLTSLHVLDLTRSAIFYESSKRYTSLEFLPKTLHTLILKDAAVLPYKDAAVLANGIPSSLYIKELALILRNTSIQILDLSFNSFDKIIDTADYAVVPFSGLRYFVDNVPDLRELYLHANLFGGELGPLGTACDILMSHPMLEIFDVGRQWVKTPSDHSKLWEKAPSRVTWEKKYNSPEHSPSVEKGPIRSKQSSSVQINNIIDKIEFETEVCTIKKEVGMHLKRVKYGNYGFNPIVNIYLAENSGGITFCFSNNSIVHLEITGYSNYPSVYKHGLNQLNILGLSNLRFLNYNDNGIDVWNMQMLSNFPSLETFLASGNILHLDTDTDNDFFNNAPHLKHIDLASCAMIDIEPEEFSHLVNLTRLNLANNGFAKDSFYINISNCKKLQYLNISGNKLTGLSNRMMQQISKHPGSLEVDLSNNPLTCECDGVDFVKWFQDIIYKRDNFETSKVTFFNNMTYLCSSRNGIVPLTNAHLYRNLDWDCSNKEVIVASVCSTVSVMLIVLLIGIIYVRRWRIQTALFNLWYIFCKQRQNSQEEDGPFKYDVFVLYNEHDRFWVHDVLMKELEGTYGFTLCLHFRNFIAGVPITNSIEAAIRSSRRVLAVVTPRFLTSDWCNTELEMARSHNKNKIIMLKLDDISTHRLPPLVAYLLDTRTYIEWNIDKAAMKLFWKKLTKAIRSRGHLKEITAKQPNTNTNNPQLGIINQGYDHYGLDELSFQLDLFD